MIAFTHPGKVGDLLYSLPTVKYICEAKGQKADFWTSEYCYPVVKRLLERQSYIDKCINAPLYKIERMDMGVQPYQIPVDNNYYETIYHLGFRSVPDCPLPQFIAHSIGSTWNGKIEYEYDDVPTLDEPYIVLAPRGETSYKGLFLNLIKECPIKTVLIGGLGDLIGSGLNKCGLDLVETLPWIAKSKGFVGLMSSQLVLANGFNIPKVSPHDGIHWDMRHVVYSDTNFYPVNPTAKEILNILGL